MKGILPLWKPKGITSHDCIMKIRELTGIHKAGHTGTLDPEVEGVLPVCIGKATKIVPFLTDTKKMYTAEIILGTTTETEDSHGHVIESRTVMSPPSQQAIENVLRLFQGGITQVPPMYSAVKVNGKKLYEYARDNESVERPERHVFIYSLDLIDESIDTHSFQVQVVCSKGTYIRTLCGDIGAQLDYPAHMGTLCRTKSGGIETKETVSFDDIENAVTNNELDKLLFPIARGLTHMEQLHVDVSLKKRIYSGQKLPKPDSPPKTEPFLMMADGQVLAIYQSHPEDKHLIKPVRVFND
ncbi:tRNA pseudouridine(55) synthase TruB [Lentibacillus halophilus]|uniref:tRNA pseudouridine synthase B n=1 Tax=Lentibacillus halophilus TaxID=295065 RepID=A0ABN0ZES6_9BACI